MPIVLASNCGLTLLFFFCFKYMKCNKKKSIGPRTEDFVTINA